AKQTANAGNPRITAISSSNVFGTSSETTSSVIANANTASLNPSMRETSRRRCAIRADCMTCASAITRRLRNVHVVPRERHFDSGGASSAGARGAREDGLPWIRVQPKLLADGEHVCEAVASDENRRQEVRIRAGRTLQHDLHELLASRQRQPG